jgi:hypothetical protein
LSDHPHNILDCGLAVLVNDDLDEAVAELVAYVNDTAEQK